MSPQLAPRSPPSALHQKWQAAQFPGSSTKFLPVFKFASTLRHWLCSDAQSISSLRNIVIVAGHRALSFCPRGSQAWSDFHSEASALTSSTLRISRRLLFSSVFKSCQSTRRACSHAATLGFAVDSASQSHLCQQKLLAILRDRSRFFDR